MDYFSESGYLHPALNQVLRSDYGYFDSISLVASYDFTHDEYLKDRKRHHYDQPLTEVLKTVLHETTHLYQTISTPYGIYHQTLRLLQTDITRYILRWVRQFDKGPLQPSLLHHALQLNVNKSQLFSMMSGWFLAEAMLLVLEGDLETYRKLTDMLNRSSLPSMSLNQLFAALDPWVSSFFVRNGKSCPKGVHGFVSDDDAFLSDLQYLLLKSASYPDNRGVLESWATAAEFWADKDVSIERDGQLFRSSYTAQKAPYYQFLNEARSSIAASTIGEFTFTYIALCEIALSPPVLQHHRGLSDKLMSSWHLNPAQRLNELFSAAKEVRPIKVPSTDYLPFTNSVCSKLGWPTPLKIAQATKLSLICSNHDLLFYFYAKSADIRCRIPHAFIDMSVWFLPEQSHMKEFYYFFSHPVIEFKDSVGFHPDPSVLTFFLNQSLLTRYSRELFIGSGKHIALPFKAETTLCETIRSTLEPHIGAFFGEVPYSIKLKSK